MEISAIQKLSVAIINQIEMHLGTPSSSLVLQQESGRQKLGGQKPGQQAQHAKLYSDLLNAQTERTFDSPGFSIPPSFLRPRYPVTNPQNKCTYTQSFPQDNTTTSMHEQFAGYKIQDTRQLYSSIAERPTLYLPDDIFETICGLRCLHFNVQTFVLQYMYNLDIGYQGSFLGKREKRTKATLVQQQLTFIRGRKWVLFAQQRDTKSEEVPPIICSSSTFE